MQQKNWKKIRAWYNKHTEPKTFNDGDFCLVLTADDSQKLYARWSPTVQIIRRVSDATYEVQLGDRKIIKHANCQRLFTPRHSAGPVVTVDETADPEDNKLPLID